MASLIPCLKTQHGGKSPTVIAFNWMAAGGLHQGTHQGRGKKLVDVTVHQQLKYDHSTAGRRKTQTAHGRISRRVDRICLR